MKVQCKANKRNNQLLHRLFEKAKWMETRWVTGVYTLCYFLPGDNDKEMEREQVQHSVLSIIITRDRKHMMEKQKSIFDSFYGTRTTREPDKAFFSRYVLWLSITGNEEQKENNMTWFSQTLFWLRLLKWLLSNQTPLFCRQNNTQ